MPCLHKSITVKAVSGATLVSIKSYKKMIELLQPFVRKRETSSRSKAKGERPLFVILWILLYTVFNLRMCSDQILC
jgi:ABC-type transport system involved in Fe-S cluster assembly fused permease/ATPase subunit